MTKKILPILACLFCASYPLVSGTAGEPLARCTTSREFITALEFLRQEKSFSLPEPQARKLATQVAGGCTGAADRFIRVSKVLAAAGMSGTDAAKIGLQFAHRTDREAQTFNAVFQRSFLAESLDLDLASSLRIARSLTLEFNGDIASVRKDFDTLVDYCLSPQKLEMPRPRCASFSAELLKIGEAWEGGVAQAFIESYEFLRSENGPALTTEVASRMAADLIARGPDGPENFAVGYRYAISQKGLDLPRNDAIGFARAMAYQTAEPEQTQPATKATAPGFGSVHVRPSRGLSSVGSKK